MSTPNPKAGLEAAGRISATIAIKQLVDAMSKMPIDSEEYKALTSAHKTLVGAFGATQEKSNELIPAELSQLMQGMPGGGMAPPGAGPMPPKPAGGPMPMPVPAA